MSIIYDALKKAQQNIHKESKTVVESGNEPSNLKQKFRPKILILYILIIGSGLFIGNVLFVILTQSIKSNHLRTEKLQTKTQIISQVEDKFQPTKKEETLPEPIREKLPKELKGLFVLNGTFFSQDEGYALINNQIVKVGDVINGATVKRISLNEVELEANGQTIKLNRSK